MGKKYHKLVVDLLLLMTAALAFTSGLVLLTRLHMGPGAVRASAAGLDRLVWQNVHRVSALFLLPCIILHIALNARPFAARFGRVFKSGVKHRGVSELVLYLAFPISVAAAFTAWLIVGNALSPFGPAQCSGFVSVRHFWIDVHHLTGLVSLPLAVHHVGHRWGWITRTLNDYIKTVSLLRKGVRN